MTGIASLIFQDEVNIQIVIPFPKYATAVLLVSDKFNKKEAVSKVRLYYLRVPYLNFFSDTYPNAKTF